jgi:hypothetical protein
MADYEIFRDQLTTTYPTYGYPLWMPSPPRPDRPVEIGDVGFLRRGKFHRLFNVLLSADHPSQEYGVPEYYEQLVPSLVDHISKDLSQLWSLLFSRGQRGDRIRSSFL